MPQEGSFPTPQRPLPLGLIPPPLLARALWAPALALIVALSTLGSGAGGGRATQGHEVVRLDGRQRVGALALALHVEHPHPGKLGPQHEGCRRRRGLLFPSTAAPWSPRAAPCSLHQPPQQQRQQ